MSSYQLKAKNKNTGEIRTFWAIDDYFGKHEYGYRDRTDCTLYDEDGFFAEFETIEELQEEHIADVGKTIVSKAEEMDEWTPEGKSQELLEIMGIFQLERTNAITEMFDNGYGENGSGTRLYPTSKFFDRLDNCVESLLLKWAEIHSSTTRSETLKEVREKVQGLKKEYRDFPNGWNTDEELGYNKAIEDVLEILTTII